MEVARWLSGLCSQLTNQPTSQPAIQLTNSPRSRQHLRHLRQHIRIHREHRHASGDVARVEGRLLSELIDPATGGPGRIIGMTTYMNIDAATPRVEIGSTWNAASAHGSGTNPDSKLLLLRHAFETLGCPAVEFRTHWLNHQSREAIARLGAKQDGVLRSHTRSSDGALRDTVVYSILEHEWPMVRNALESRLAKRR